MLEKPGRGRFLRRWWAALMLGAILGAVGGAVSIREAEAATTSGRVIIGLREPVTPAMLQEIRKAFRGQIIMLAPSGAYALILLPRGASFEAIKKRSPNIAYVEAEIAMGIPTTSTTAVLMPAPRPLKQKKRK